ncbi:sulfur carrier protein ThiS [Desulfocurvus sp.]|jgi:thiamine biosynthesis protein ThiS|uniref:sulfur carrier protein ThiS n=1 Tax=Desulfocurvus sp. TaxID=2871698 RepID=UPI0025B876E1|nr:sulfur carrier protein ThiS [Desulfocurvus sp.]MCK9239283.1 sulfur carrier protein ThiS [Desulfocurvus sp.]
MTLTVNGSTRPLPRPANVAALLRDCGLDPAVVVVERNGTIVPGADYAATPLEPGDTLEILSFVGGG